MKYVYQGTDTYYSIFTATFFKIYHKKGYAIWGYMDMISISPFFFVHMLANLNKKAFSCHEKN